MVNMKTSLAAQRTETFEEQGFKNIFVKVFLQKPNYFQTKMTNSTITIFPKKYPNLP